MRPNIKQALALMETKDDFVDLALEAIDQAGASLNTQRRVKALIDYLRDEREDGGA